VYPPGKRLDGGVLYSRVARNHSGLGESVRKVGICMKGSTYIVWIGIPSWV
jgi:hypothetical protein